MQVQPLQQSDTARCGRSSEGASALGPLIDQVSVLDAELGVLLPQRSKDQRLEGHVMIPRQGCGISRQPAIANLACPALGLAHRGSSTSPGACFGRVIGILKRHIAVDQRNAYEDGDYPDRGQWP